MSSCAMFSKKQRNNVKEVGQALEAPIFVSMEPVYDIEVTDLNDKISRIFTLALIDNDVALLNEYLPNVATLRMIVGDETKTLTDKEVQEKMADAIVERFKTNFELLQTAIDQNDIDRAKLKYKAYAWEPGTNSMLAPVPLLIVLDYAGEEIAIPVTVLIVDAKCILFEILKTTNIFSE